MKMGITMFDTENFKSACVNMEQLIEKCKSQQASNDSDVYI